MKRIIFFVLLLIANAATAQNGQFVEHFKLDDFQCTEGLTSDLLKAALSGKIQAYNWVSDKPEKMAGADITNKLRIKGDEEYPIWDPTVFYLPGDRVNHEGKNWECLNDPAPGRYPATGSEDWTQLNAPMYFEGSNIDVMRVQYSVSNGKRINEWLHFIVSMNRSPSFWDEHIVSFQFSEVMKFLDTTPRVFYANENKALGWVTGDIYFWLDSYHQAGLIKALGEYAYRERTDCKIHISMDKFFEELQKRNDLLVADPFSDEQVLPFYKLNFRWRGNVLDSIRIYYDYYQPIRVADIPHKAFQKSLKTSKSGSFKGFVDLNTALELSILTPMQRDTLSPQSQAKTETPPSKLVSKAVGTYKIKQTIFCPLTNLGNQSIQQGDENFGSYILKAIREWKFDNIHRPYQNDSLNSLISRAEMTARIIYQEGYNFSPWDVGASYIKQDIVIYKGKKYGCIEENIGTKEPPDSPAQWELIGDETSELNPSDISAINLHYWYTFNKNGQIVGKQLYAVSIFAFIDYIGIYKPIMTLSSETLKVFLTDGAQGLRIWSTIEKGKLVGYMSGSSAIIRAN
jgi:hypothetical protein